MSTSQIIVEHDVDSATLPCPMMLNELFQVIGTTLEFFTRFSERLTACTSVFMSYLYCTNCEDGGWEWARMAIMMIYQCNKTRNVALLNQQALWVTLSLFQINKITFPHLSL